MKVYSLRGILPLLYSSFLTVVICLRAFAQDPALAPPEPPQWSVLEDADQDGLTDWDEFILSLDPLNPLDGLSDADGDELWLAWEWQLGTHSDLADTDGDGWSDSLEVLLYGTDPLDPASKPLGNVADNVDDTSAALEPEQTSVPPEEEPPPPPPSLSNGDFTDIGIQNWKDQSFSKSYQGGGFKWGEGMASSWSAYVGKTIEVWQANGETFVELDGNTTSYGIKQPITNARAGAFILTWKQSGRNDTNSGTNPYYVRIYHESDKGPVVISDSKEFSGYDKLKWTDNAHVFNITPEQFTAAAGKPIYVAFIPISLNTYGTLIDKVAIHTMDLIAHKRGTINIPGPEQPKGNGEYGYETVMMENADSEDNNDGKRDCETEEGANKSKDNDLVKIVLYYDGPKIDGASLELQHEGISVNAKAKGSVMTNPQDAIEVLDTGSRLNFYDNDGKKLDPANDLKIQNLKNPESGYLAKILDPVNSSKLTFFIEGSNLFGFQGSKDGQLPRGEWDDVKTVDTAMQKLGGARLRLIFSKGAQKIEIPLLVYRGGFLVFKQPKNKPGVAGDFEFWDGKGRIRNKSDGYKKEFQEDETHWGKKLAKWSAKSGRPSDEPDGNTDYKIENGNGHTPPGWWWTVDNSPLYNRETQLNKYWISNVNGKQQWRQASFSRWKQDDESDTLKKYTNDWIYDASIKKDEDIGKPTLIEYKFRLFPITPTTRYQRNGLLLHPDGKRDGTIGCIGIQTYNQCENVAKLLRAYNGLKIKVEPN